jgi:hypothetical protein
MPMESAECLMAHLVSSSHRLILAQELERLMAMECDKYPPY